MSLKDIETGAIQKLGHGFLQWRIHGGGAMGAIAPPEAEGGKFFYESRKIFCAQD